MHHIRQNTLTHCCSIKHCEHQQPDRLNHTFVTDINIIIASIYKKPLPTHSKFKNIHTPCTNKAPHTGINSREIDDLNYNDNFLPDYGETYYRDNLML